MSASTHETTVSALRRLAGLEGMELVMRRNDIDIVLAASDSTLVAYSAWAGWPVATVPLGNWDKNGQPWGMFALARTEGDLVRFMAGWEKAGMDGVQRRCV